MKQVSFHVKHTSDGHVSIDIEDGGTTVTVVLPSDAAEHVASVIAKHARLAREIPQPPTPKHPKLKLVR